MPKVMQGSGPNARRVVVSLCDYSGNWPRPWNVDHGCTVLHYAPKHGDDVLNLAPIAILRDCANAVSPAHRGFAVACVLAAPPCTDFSVSGAQYWKAKDADGRTEKSLGVLDACVWIAKTLSPDCWALENPVGRIPKLRPELGKPLYYFHPHEYALWADEPEGDRYTKKTGIWGEHVRPITDAELHAKLPHEMPPALTPIRVCAQGSWLQKLGGKSERTKELRSMTPAGFARGFAAANI